MDLCWDDGEGNTRRAEDPHSNIQHWGAFAAIIVVGTCVERGVVFCALLQAVVFALFCVVRVCMRS